MNVHPKNCSSYHPCCCMVKTAFKYVFPPNRDDDFCLIFCIYPSSMIRKQGITSVLGGVVKIIWNPVKNDDFSIPILVFYIYRYATKQLHTKERILSRINDEWSRNPMQRNPLLLTHKIKKGGWWHCSIVGSLFMSKTPMWLNKMESRNEVQVFWSGLLYIDACPILLQLESFAH